MLAEGVDLHRANVIVHYDSPWNPTRLMQRNGRVNRIGSVADTIYNYLFYPSAEGDAEIRLYRNILAKLQGFHSAYGGDSQIFSREEVLCSFELFNPNIGDDVDKMLQYLDEVRRFRKAHPADFERVRNLPVKSRTGRCASRTGGRKRHGAGVCPFGLQTGVLQSRAERRPAGEAGRYGPAGIHGAEGALHGRAARVPRSGGIVPGGAG